MQIIKKFLLILFVTHFLIMNAVHAKNKDSIDSIILKDYYSIKTYWKENKELPDKQFKKIIKREEQIKKNIVDIKATTLKKELKQIDKSDLLKWHRYNSSNIAKQSYYKPISMTPKNLALNSNNKLSINLAYNTKKPEQGTTLALYIKCSKKVKIYKSTLGNRKISFLELKKHIYRALIPFDLLESPGKKKISIKLHDFKQSYHIQDIIEVQSRLKTVKNEKSNKVKVKKRNEAIKLRFSKKKTKLLTHTDRYKERYFFYEQFKKKNDKQHWDGLFHYPIKKAKIKSNSFGRFRKYISKNKVLNGYHRGIDISKPKGTSVHSSNNGKVVISGKYKIRGNAVVIDHGMGVYSCYFHMSKLNVKKGDSVNKGQKIGEVGSTGLSTGNHLHWEIRLNGISVNPIQWCQYDFNKDNIRHLESSKVKLVREQAAEPKINTNIVYKSPEIRPGKSSKYGKLNTIDNFR